MHAAGIDLSGGRLGGPRLKKHGRAITSSRWGSSTDDVCPAGRAGENRDWNLDDPDGKSAAEVGRIRDEIERRVTSLFDEPESRR
jgi:arsenate reductase